MAESSKKKLDSKTKKILFIGGVILDIGLTVFLLVVSILMVAMLPDAGILPETDGMIGYLQNNLTVFACAIVLPLFLLLVANIIVTVYFVTSAKEEEKKELVNEIKATTAKSLADLTDEQKELLKKMLLDEANKQKEASEKKDN